MEYLMENEKPTPIWGITVGQINDPTNYRITLSEKGEILAWTGEGASLRSLDRTNDRLVFLMIQYIRKLQKEIDALEAEIVDGTDIDND